MKILVTGSKGQLGRSLARVLPTWGHEVILTDREELDITDRSAVESWVNKHDPGVIVNAAAYTAVDRAEDEPDLARTLNVDGPKHLAEAGAQRAIPLVHVSTDYVFSGRSELPYSEEDATGPLGVYGQTKLDGELAVRSAQPAHVIIRASWLFSEFGTNFVKTMLRLGRERDELRVVADQWGAPTSARSLAELIARVVGRLESQTKSYGTYHFANVPATSWHGFSSAILRQALTAGYGGIKALVIPIATSEFPTRARRPQFSVLDLQRVQRVFDFEIPDWRDELRWVLARIIHEPRRY